MVVSEQFCISPPIQQTVFIFTTLGTNERWLFYPHARTQPVWTLFLFKSIWTRSQGSRVSKNQIFLQIKLLSFCPRIAPKRHKLQKIIKIEKKKKCQKTLVFLEDFKYSSIWGQYQHTKHQMVRLVTPGAFFDTRQILSLLNDLV